MERLNTVFCGGFFDHFHAAHRAAMARVAKLECRQVIILVASDRRVGEKRKPFHELTQPQHVRLRNVKAEVAKIGFKAQVTVRLTHHSIDPEILTHRGPIAVILEFPAAAKARAINRGRLANGLKPARVIAWKRPPVPISSTEIRRRKLEARKNAAVAQGPRRFRRRGK